MSDEFEHLLVGDEVRADGRTLVGTVMVYGDRANSRRERFEPGSLELAPVTHLDYEHDRSRVLAYSPGGGLSFEDGEDELRMTATLPPLAFADHVLEEVRAGRRSGLSIEFRDAVSRTEGGVRVIEKALLRGVAICRSPDYGASRLETRARRRRVWL